MPDERFVYDFEKLTVYQESLSLVELVYQATRDFPKEEMFGLISQVRRAAMSVSLNIAEGKGRFYTKVFVQFLYQARGSLYETMTLIKLSNRLEYLKESRSLLDKCDVIAIQLNNLIKTMK